MVSEFHSIGVLRLRIENDGDGVTTLVAGHGCPLRCRYCLNPQCFVKTKPARSYTIEELLEAVRMDDLYFQATGGGIVFGGGEPLLQADFIHAFCQAAPSAWKMGLESSLCVPKSELEKVIDDIDFYIIDIKDMNPEIYQAYTGRTNEPVCRNLKYLASHADPAAVRIRIPLIQNFNTEVNRRASEKQLKEMGFSCFEFFTYDCKTPEERLGNICS